MATLPLSIIADVSVVTSSPQVASPTFNTGLVIGNSGIIPSYGVNPRVRIYQAATYTSAMATDGFIPTSPEMICATMYFSQSPQPAQIAIGCQDPTAIGALTLDTGHGGTGYAVGDLFTVTQGGASFGIGRVSAETAGVVTAVTLYQQGTGYAVATALATVANTGVGTGLEVNITSIGETPLQAFQACRLANATWYPGMVTTAVDADHIAISAWALTQTGTLYFGNTNDSAVANGSSGNLFTTLFNAGSKRTWMQWASTQGGLYPNQIYFTAAVMGQAMASNTQLANSSFTEKFSGGVPLVGVYTEPTGPSGLSSTQITNIEGVSPATGPNGNMFLNYGNAFNILEQGTMMASGVFLDQVLGLDVLASNIQYNIMNLLTSVPKVPQTDAGQQLLIQAVEAALAQSATTGFIATGIWNGQNILGKVVPGQSLPNGYAVVSPLYRTLTAAQIAARQAPPIYVALIEAGAVHFVTVEVLVQI